MALGPALSAMALVWSARLGQAETVYGYTF
jgi:hypothetical protein